jgi:hypothetical protein
MESYALDKLKVYKAPSYLSTLDAAVCFKRVGMIASRLFNLNDRVLLVFMTAGNEMVQFAMECAHLYPRFEINNSAVVLFNEMLKGLTSAWTCPASTTIHLEDSIQCMRVNENMEWIQKRLKRIETDEHTELMSQKLTMTSFSHKREYVPEG